MIRNMSACTSRLSEAHCCVLRKIDTSLPYYDSLCAVLLRVLQS